MKLKLGQEVKFSHSFKATGKSVGNNIEFLNEELYQELRETWVEVPFKERVEHAEMRGIIVGKRQLCASGRFTVNMDMYDTEFVEHDLKFVTVYLVACNLSGFKRVLPEDIRIVGYKV